VRWFLVEADITAREAPEDRRLAFFTVLVVKRMERAPTLQQAGELVDQYLREVHAPFSWETRLISIEETGPPPTWVRDV
jgi:hypothetical protein